MTIGIVPNISKDTDLSYTREVSAYLRERGVQVFIAEPGNDDGEVVFRDVSLVVVLGGDGTMLRASHKAALYGTPMLGINLGTMGYLTDVDRHEGLDALDKVLNNKYRLERRMMLTIEGCAADGLPAHDVLALNDVYLSRGGFGKLIAFHVFINGLLMDTLRADGMIIATPTGSTAYNLSAGGPILMPDGEMMVVTAVCPHALYTRPWVITPDDTVEIRAADDNACVAIDGESRLTLKRGGSLFIRRAVQTAVIVKTSSMNFYEILRLKIGCNTEGR